MPDRPFILTFPLPHVMDLIFAPKLLADLRARDRSGDTTDEALTALPCGVRAGPTLWCGSME